MTALSVGPVRRLSYTVYEQILNIPFSYYVILDSGRLCRILSFYCALLTTDYT